MTSDKLYLASMYYMNIFPPSKAIIFQNGKLVAHGEVQRADPFKVILERTILTGYPFKVRVLQLSFQSRKKKSIVRLMFFNAQDINYYKPVELWTKNGLRGQIKQSVGTHGYMKCIFNNYIKHNDIVCMNLYRRVFPDWPKELS